MAHSQPYFHAFHQEMELALLRQQEPLLILKLAMYAADAMRVLTSLKQQTDVSPSLAQTLKGICPDWLNPGVADDPADLIAQALFYSVDGLQKAMATMERVLRSMQPQAEPLVQPDA